MEFDKAVKELEVLIETLERDQDERALLLLQLVDAIHRPAIELILAGEPEHPIAHAVLTMYDLADVEEQIQVEEALDEVRPYIESHGGELELLEVDDGTVHVRLSGSCSGCAGSTITLKRGVEEVLREHYENFKEVVAHEADGAEVAAEANGGGGGPTLLQIEGLKKPSETAKDEAVLKRPVFLDAGALEELSPGTMKAVESEGKSILIVNVAGEPYAFRNLCPVDGRLPLDGGRLTGNVLVCPWHNCGYDARTGKRADNEEGDALAVVPVAVRDGLLKVAVNVA
ncbi:MAG: NifU family protein [Thermoleophilaceae bacterium]